MAVMCIVLSQGLKVLENGDFCFKIKENGDFFFLSHKMVIFIKICPGNLKKKIQFQNRLEIYIYIYIYYFF